MPSGWTPSDNCNRAGNYSIDALVGPAFAAATLVKLRAALTRDKLSIACVLQFALGVQKD